MRIKVASYNIHKAVGLDRRRNPERILTILHEIGADIVALQEADRRFGTREGVLPRQMIDDLTHYAPVSVPGPSRSLGWHGNAVLVRRGIEVEAVAPLNLPTLEPRGALCCDLRIEGRLLRVVAMHLDLSGLLRRQQLRAVLRHLDECPQPAPTVLMGDFNEWAVRGGAFRELGAWQVLAPGRSFPARRPVAGLDRIVLSGDWQCEDAGVHHSILAARGSDHLPVWAMLGLPKK